VGGKKRFKNITVRGLAGSHKEFLLLILTGNNKTVVRPDAGNAVMVAVAEKLQTGKSKFRNTVRCQRKAGMQDIF
jgi:hypothetical protein